MTRKKKTTEDHTIFQWAEFTTKQLSEIADVELVTLKIHIVIESALRYLLATRLGVSENKLGNLRLNFDLTTRLALMGIGDSNLLGGILALNRARNALAHHLTRESEVQENLEKFVQAMGYMNKDRVAWPASSSEQLNALKDAFDVAAHAIFELAKWDIGQAP